MIDFAAAGEILERWVEPVGYLRQDVADGFLLSDGETKRYLQRVGDAFVVSTSQRSERPKLDMSSKNLDDAVRYLVASFGVGVRESVLRDSARLDFPTAADELADGFELTVATDSELNAVLSESGRERARFRSYAYPFEAVRFSHYSRVDIEDLQATFLDPAGRPLFPLAPPAPGR